MALVELKAAAPVCEMSPRIPSFFMRAETGEASACSAGSPKPSGQTPTRRREIRPEGEPMKRWTRRASSFEMRRIQTRPLGAHVTFHSAWPTQRKEGIRLGNPSKGRRARYRLHPSTPILSGGIRGRAAAHLGDGASCPGALSAAGEPQSVT